MENQSPPRIGLARQTQVLNVIPIGRSTLWRMVNDGRFPPPVRPSPLGPAVTVWRWEDVHAFIAGKWDSEGSK